MFWEKNEGLTDWLTERRPTPEPLIRIGQEKIELAVWQLYTYTTMTDITPANPMIGNKERIGLNITLKKIAQYRVVPGSRNHGF